MILKSRQSFNQANHGSDNKKKLMAQKKNQGNPSIRQIKVQTITPAQRLSGIIKSCRNIMRKDKGMNGDADRLPMLTWIMFLKF